MTAIPADRGWPYNGLGNYPFSVEALRARLRDLEAGFDALARLVLAEYPDDKSLADIAETWGEGITPEQVDALRRLADQ